jgi:hypothetical protein
MREAGLGIAKLLTNQARECLLATQPPLVLARQVGAVLPDCRRRMQQLPAALAIPAAQSILSSQLQTDYPRMQQGTTATQCSNFEAATWTRPAAPCVKNARGSSPSAASQSAGTRTLKYPGPASGAVRSLQQQGSRLRKQDFKFFPKGIAATTTNPVKQAHICKELCSHNNLQGKSARERW